MSVPVVPVHFCKARRVIEHDLARTTRPVPDRGGPLFSSPPDLHTRDRRREVPRRTGHPPSASSLRGFLAIASNGALFIQWTRTGNTVRGTLSEAYRNLSDPTQAQSESHPVTGIISGSSITLTIDSGDNWNGTLEGSRLTLSYANNDGSLKTFDFRPASVDDYNAAVANVQASAGEAQSQRQQAQAAQQARAAAQRARQQARDSANAVLGDMSALSDKVSSLKSDLAQVASDLGQMRQDLATEAADLKKVLADSPANVCNDNYQVSGTDAYQVTGTDDYQITGTDEYQFSNDLSDARDGIAQLSSDTAKLKQDAIAASGYIAPGTPSASAVAALIQQARAAIGRAEQQWNGYLATAKQLDAKADSYGAQADAACNKSGG
jgi:cob(I)alamin adenosyltransferase